MQAAAPAGTVDVGVLVVGGGPAGYSTAIALARQGFGSIHILEQAPSAAFFDPSKSFVYSLSREGKNVLRHSCGIGAIDSFGLCLHGMRLKMVHPDRKVEHKTLLTPPEGLDDTQANTWLPRHVLNSKLCEHVQQHHGDAVTVSFGVHVKDVHLPSAPGDSMYVETEPASSHSTGSSSGSPAPDGDSAVQTYRCQLLIGADGASSKVRRALQARFSGWDMQVSPSDSGKLCWKVLPLPPCPQFSDATGVLYNTQTANLPGRSVDGNAPLRMGLLPGKDNTQPRTATFILNADHPFWQVSTPDALYRYLRESFPQVDPERWPDLVPLEAAERFVRTKAGAFPHPQMCPKLVAQFEDAAAPADTRAAIRSLRGCGALLLGDAAHVFPPDLGQGVNSALLDVSTISECFERHAGDLNSALAEYEAHRLPENKALVRLMQAGLAVAAPIAANVKNVNPGTMYRDALQAANRTTRNIWVALGLLAVMVAKACGLW